MLRLYSKGFKQRIIELRQYLLNKKYFFLFPSGALAVLGWKKEYGIPAMTQ